jgi:hypothetical protein
VLLTPPAFTFARFALALALIGSGCSSQDKGGGGVGGGASGQTGDAKSTGGTSAGGAASSGLGGAGGTGGGAGGGALAGSGGATMGGTAAGGTGGIFTSSTASSQNDGGTEPQGVLSGPVKLSDSTVAFKHQHYTENANHSLGDVGGQIETTTFDVKIIENDLVKVTVLPSYGGRVLSMIYKPTGHEMLYQNPIGTPYGKGNGSFYYDWLMVYGGIFPTFPEPEHGKMWLLPWTATVVTKTDDEVALRMTKKDDIAPSGGIPPANFKYGRTDLEVSATVRVVRGSSAVRLDLEVANSKATPVSYEYWTCTTLAPGSVPGKPKSPASSEMVVPISQVFIESRWAWMRQVEAATATADVFAFSKLALFSNWSDMGIAYAYPAVSKPWWGVLNHENNVGIFRVADPAATPGLKFWTWGASSVNANPDQPSQARPYIELWGGHSQRFFTPAQLAAGAKKQWTEVYLPTVGMTKFSEVTEGAAAWLTYSKGADTVTFNAELFTALPSRALRVRMSLEGAQSKQLLDQSWTPDAKTSSTLTASVPTAQLPAGATKLALVVAQSNGDVVLKTDVAYQ